MKFTLIIGILVIFVSGVAMLFFEKISTLLLKDDPKGNYKKLFKLLLLVVFFVGIYITAAAR